MVISNLKDLCKEHLGEAFNANQRYTDMEMLHLLDLHMRSQEGRLAKARAIYKQQRDEILKSKQEPLWRFATPHVAPPDFKREYKLYLEGKREKP